MASGLLPYKHFSAEYPPLAMLFLFAARLPVAFGASYSISFVLLMAALDWVQKWMLRDAFAARPLAYWLACGVGTLLLLPTYFNHFDIAPTFCCSLALVAWLQRPSEWRGWLWLAVAVGLKVEGEKVEVFVGRLAHEGIYKVHLESHFFLPRDQTEIR